MSTTIKILIGIAGAVVLSPLLLRLARRWRDGAAGIAAGSVVPSEGIGPYITNLRHEARWGEGGYFGDDAGDGGSDGGDGGGE